MDISGYSLDELEELQFDPSIVGSDLMTVTSHLISNGRKPAVWYYHSDGQEVGPTNYLQLNDLYHSGVIRPETLVWRDRMEQWISFEAMTNVAASGPAHTSVPPTIPRPDNTKTGGILIAGILQACMVFVWAFLTILQFFESGVGFEGKFFGAIFCLCMLVLSIPTSIGLIASRKWGYYFKLVIGAAAFFWMVRRLMDGVNNEWWILLIALDSVILALVLLNTRNFK